MTAEEQKQIAIAKSLQTEQGEVEKINKIALSIDLAIFGFSENTLKVLGDLIKPTEELDTAAYRVLRQRTGMDDVFLEQVHTFGEVKRHPAGRVVTIAYYSLINIEHHKLNILDNELHWHDVKSVTNLAFDHQQIFETCYRRLQKRIQEHPLGFSLLPKKFSLRELQNLYEAILDTKLDRRNFRKKFFSMDLLTDMNEMERDVPHRPGKLYQFNYKKYEKRKKVWVGIDF